MPSKAWLVCFYLTIIAQVNELKVILFQASESFLHAVQGLTQNKLRALLSTLGITIGIFCIIMVLTLVNSLERNIQQSVDDIGKDVLFIEKWPWEFSDDYKWWKYMNRPNPTLLELAAFQQRSELAKAAALKLSLFGIVIKHGNNTASNVQGNAVTHDYDKINKINLQEGRYFTENESRSGAHVVIIGNTIAENLFGNISPIGKTVTIKGSKYTVIGLIEKEGESLLGNSKDNTFLMPVITASRYVRVNSNYISSQIQIKPKDGIPLNLMEEEATVIMRSVRKLKPQQEENFALNKTTLIAEPLKRIFGIVNLAGWIIGLFAMLVGGFGISNIMFVSVKERTAQIGIKKALGAKTYTILIEFLFEAIMLCIAGGLFGLLLVALCAKIAESSFEFSIYMSASNVITGLLVSIIVGVISGYAPARNAARLDPVEAMRSK